MSLAKELLTKIEEGVNDNYLYHFTSLLGALKILESDKIDSRVHDKRSSISTVGVDNSEGNWVSFTRNKNYQFRGHMMILAFDRRKLSTKYKIETYDHYNGRDRAREEMEERIKSPILKVKSYLSKIIIKPLVYTSGLKSVKGLFDSSSAMDTYIKLRDLCLNNSIELENKELAVKWTGSR